jgi:hypothetical protein
MSSEEMIRCPHCGKMHPKDMLYCPENGMPIYQTESVPEPKPPASRRTNFLWIIAGSAIGVAALCIISVVVILFLRNSVASRSPTLTPAAIIIATMFESTPTLEPSLTGPAPADTPLPEVTIVPTSGPWQACSGAAYLSRLHIGDKAEVSADPPVANNVRSEPSLSATLLGQIQPGEDVTIIDGPGCSGNWVWWKVRSLITNLEGWTAEGDNTTYWLIPLP